MVTEPVFSTLAWHHFWVEDQTEVNQTLKEMQANNQLIVLSGRILSYDAQSQKVIVTYRPRHQQETKTLEVGIVMNCIGPDASFNKINEPLVVNLREQGLILSDALGLGIDTTEQFEVLTAQGQTLSNVLAVGPLLKGLLWESVAVPELRGQTAWAAKYLFKNLLQ